MPYIALVRGGGPVGLAAGLALARRGTVLMELATTPNDTARVDSLPLPLLPTLIELGLHPSRIEAQAPATSVLTSWETERPVVRDVAPRLHVDRRLLERELLSLVEAHPRIDIVHEKTKAIEAEFHIDATGRRAASAPSIVEPPAPWIARSHILPGRFTAAQQALRIAPFAGGYFYRIATPNLATLGVVGPALQVRTIEALMDLLERTNSGWILSGLNECRSALPGRGGKASVQRSIPAESWLQVGDAAFACDALSSQGLANGISSAMKLVRSVPDRWAPYFGHIRNISSTVDRCRFREYTAWRDYADFLSGEERLAGPLADRQTGRSSPQASGSSGATIDS